MAPQIIFKYQSPDSTAYLNQRLASLITKGVYDGGLITPVGGGSLSATRLPFLAIGKDGITIADSESATVTYTAGSENYHCILAKYNAYGVPSTPVVSELILSASGYASHPDKAYLILLAVVTPTAEVLLEHIDYSSRDSVGPFGHSWLKGTVATTADLPEDSPTVLVTNKVGDLYLVQADWGVYVWTGSMWRLIAAMGAATLDGAYDDNAGTAIPGAGRYIYADAGAVEIVQSTASQRQNDLANAALRIRETGTTTYGDVGLDIVSRENYDLASILVRSIYTQGTDLQKDEPIDIMGPTTVQGIRAGVNWTNVQKSYIQLVEISGSTLGNDGLYLVDVVSSDEINTRLLNGSPTAFIVEPGLTANFYTVRFSTGSAYNWLGYSDLGPWGVGSIENWGNAGNTGAVGKVWYVEADTLGFVMQVRRTTPSDLNSWYVASIDQWGGGFFSSEVTWGLVGYSLHSGTGAIFGVTYAANSVGVFGVSGSWIGVQGEGDTVGVVGITYGGSGSIGVQGFQDSDPDGYGVYGEGTSGSVGVFGRCMTGSNAGVRGESYDTDGCGVFGYHLGPADEPGFGVIGHNNNSNVDYPAVDGFAWGSGPGVRGQSVFGQAARFQNWLTFEPAIYANSFLGTGIFAEASGGWAIGPAIHGEGNWIRPGVYCTSATTDVNGEPEMAFWCEGQALFNHGGFTGLNSAFRFPATTAYDGAEADAYGYPQIDHAAAIIIRDPQQGIYDHAHVMDYWGREARGNTLFDDFLYANWTAHGVNVPPIYYSYADTGMGSYVKGAPWSLGGAVELNGNASMGSYAALSTHGMWATYRSDAGGTIRGRMFARVYMTTLPVMFSFGFCNNVNPLSATKWCCIATGLPFSGYEDWWNFYYYNSGTGQSVKQEIIGPWDYWLNYNCTLVIKDNTHVIVYVNNSYAREVALPGAETFGSTSQWSAYIEADGHVGLCDQWYIWHDQANIWTSGYATPGM